MMLKRVVILASQKNNEDFTSNNFSKCAQVKELKDVILFSYEYEKTVEKATNQATL